MQLNVLDDLAEAMKALDGKKSEQAVFVDGFVSCWGMRGANRLLLEPT